MPNSTCLNCGSSEMERPLITLKFRENEVYICPQCLPTLIHKSSELADKLPEFQAADYPTGRDD